MNDFDHKTLLNSLTTRPGIYQMYDGEGQLLYVGKAKNLKNRVGSYFRASGLTDKTLSLVSRIRDIQVTVTTTEVDALLLEHNLIKAHQPPYNILLRDDKSYPYIFLSSEDKYPRVTLHRGAKRRKGTYFGPYPSASAVRESLHFMQKIFKVRQCEDAYFKNRSRPCLQYQIDRCSGPCVGLVDEEDYALQVEKTSLFLRGKSQQLMVRLADDMEQAAAALEYEKAATYRDQISQLQHVQANQGIEGVSGDLDILAAATSHGRACVQVLFVRDARVLGSRTYYPPLKLQEDPAQVLGAFIPQFYLDGARAGQEPAEQNGCKTISGSRDGARPPSEIVQGLLRHVVRTHRPGEPAGWNPVGRRLVAWRGRRSGHTGEHIDPVLAKLVPEALRENGVIRLGRGVVGNHGRSLEAAHRRHQDDPALSALDESAPEIV